MKQRINTIRLKYNKFMLRNVIIIWVECIHFQIVVEFPIVYKEILFFSINDVCNHRLWFEKTCVSDICKHKHLFDRRILFLLKYTCNSLTKNMCHDILLSIHRFSIPFCLHIFIFVCFRKYFDTFIVRITCIENV